MDAALQTLSQLSPDRMTAALELVHYMLSDGVKADDADDVLIAMSQHIRNGGVPLDRATSIVPLLHAEAVASARVWENETGARSFLFPFAEDVGDEYDHSPAAEVHKTGEWVTLWLHDTPDERYRIIPDLKADGYTHYIMAPVFMRAGLAGTFSFATKSGKGFSSEDVAFLRAVFPALAACQEILTITRAMGEVMRMYVGEEPRERILSGDVHRGEVMHLEAAILFADMRRFTDLTSKMSAEEATNLLNSYYDCIVPPIEAAGGEVLKFIGDGVLAVFRAQADGKKACPAALKAAIEALERVRVRTESPPFEVGISLHFGEVAFGNVGSGMRLDYTVIGRDVNLAARLADLCGKEGEPLLLSDAFCRRASPDARSIGRFELKGIEGAQSAFVPQ
ncbi:MAG: adenylate/guanylate cyclase domain-containing protein [Paracoccaceae bacterium]